MILNQIQFTNLNVIYWILLILILVTFILRKKFVKEDLRLVKTNRRKRILFVLRFIIFLSLLVALSSPYYEETQSLTNFSKIKVLIDKSTSMELYDNSLMVQKLENSQIPIEIKYLELDEFSNIGTSVLNNIHPNENILIISDGQNNFGTKLSEVGLFAASINSKIFGVTPIPKNKDLNIVIEGPGKVVSDVENEFTFRINQVGSFNRINVEIYLDDELILESQYNKPIIIKKRFKSGEHLFKTVLKKEDYFDQNNIFYKTVSVYDKPKILYVSKSNSPLKELYQAFYSVSSQKNLDTDLDQYYAVVLNNMHSNDLTDENIEKLEDYVLDGNGLFVIGGKDSYDWGEYNNSIISNILPVNIGKASKRKDIVNIMILMDTGSSSLEEIATEITFFDVQKSLLADLVRSLSDRNNVGLIEANYYLSTFSGLSELGPKRPDIINQISYMLPHASTEINKALAQARSKLRLIKGSKNIIILTDGILSPIDEQLTLDQVKKAGQDGMKTYIIGVGQNANQEFLESVKSLGGGEYFKVDESDKIKLYFGDTSGSKNDNLELFVYDSNHFITKKIEQLGPIYGFNNVYPKNNARMILTTNKGDPILTVWNYGLGRVASMSTDDGSLWSPDLLQDINSKVLIKSLNWLIENPERKNEEIISIPELRSGESAQINVISKNPVSDNSVFFYETKKGVYKGNFYSNNTGVTKILDKLVAVNYKSEYLYIGINKDFQNMVEITGGQIINMDNDNYIEQLKSVSIVDSTVTNDLSWIFVILALVIYFIELLIRRFWMISMSKIN